MMDLIEINIVSAEATQAGLTSLKEMLTRETLGVGSVSHAPTRFGGDHQLGPLLPGQPASGHFLRLAAGVDVRGVDQVDAEVDRLIEDAKSCLLFHAPAEVDPGAERDL